MTPLTFADVVRFLRDMRHFAKLARGFSEGKSIADLEADLQYRCAVLYALQVIGEAASKVPKPVRVLAPEIPWTRIVAFRHVVVHGYAAVRDVVVDEILRQEMPRLIPELDRLHEIVVARGEEPLP